MQRHAFRLGHPKAPVRIAERLREWEHFHHPALVELAGNVVVARAGHAVAPHTKPVVVLDAILRDVL